MSIYERPESTEPNIISGSPLHIAVHLLPFNPAGGQTHLWSVFLQSFWAETPQWNVLMYAVHSPNYY